MAVQGTRTVRSMAWSRLVRGVFPLAFALVSVFTGISGAAAQYGEYYEPKRDFESPEWFAIELIRGGFYRPSEDAAFDIFGGDNGPKIGGEIDFMPYRIPYVGLIGAGYSPSWASYKTRATISGGTTQSDENTTVTLYPQAFLGVLRVDGLSRELGIPFIFTGKLGLDVIPWEAKTGSSTDGEGVALGFHWALQLGLELDWIEPKKARALDDVWGINHTFVFAELYGSTAKDNNLDLGDRLAWAAGFGMTF